MADDTTQDLIIVLVIVLALKLGQIGLDNVLDGLKWLLMGLISLSLAVLLIIYLAKRFMAKKQIKRLEIATPILSEIIEQPLTEKELPKIVDNRKTDEMPQIAAIPQRKEFNITLDSDKRFFRFRELKLEEVKYLLAKGYRISEHKSLSSNKKEKYLLKPRFNESVNHCFVVYDIANFLEKRCVNVSLFVTKKPDLVFEINSRKFAIEVETGKNRYKTEKLKEKVKLLKIYDYWFFVITNRNCSKQYRKFGKVVELRRLRNFLLKILENGHPKTAGKKRFISWGSDQNSIKKVTSHNSI